ncbi:MAG: AI-2E family transporter [Armatimonadota bacterium]
MQRNVFLSPAARFVLMGACLVILIAGLKAGAPVLAPTLFALLIAIAVTPLIHWLDQKGLPTWTSVLVVVLGSVALGVGLVLFTLASIASLSDNLPGYQTRLVEHLDGLTAWLAGYNIHLPTAVPSEVLNFSRITSVLGAVLGTVGSGLSGFFLVLILFIVFSIETPRITALFREHLGSDSAAVSRFITLGGRITSYFNVRAINNLFVSIVLTILLLILRVDLAGLWGILAFFLGYIPNIGLPLAVAPAVLLAWIGQGWIAALIVVIGSVVINIIGDNVLTPRLAGKALNMSTAVVFLSFIFWSWVFGALGALISIPLTAIVVVALDSFDETRWLATLMSAEAIPASPKEEEAAVVVPVETVEPSKEETPVIESAPAEEAPAPRKPRKQKRTR